ncbi:hypothetical protein CSUI_001844 [Cystoisospora suis]|uniref:Uncharacterized protein n=1 Tax=Cystoisospora suis TaxID=483139 RepID=A0A2C6LB29_9APIC|nr:hypothetical protein CSUI_001844 [Cystoisospora suis]
MTSLLLTSSLFKPTGGLRSLCSSSPSSFHRMKSRFFASAVSPSSSLAKEVEGSSPKISLLGPLKKSLSRSSSSSSSATSPNCMLVENPRPTQYQTEICKQALHVEPGVEKSSTKGLIALTFLLIAVPILLTRIELNRYYAKYGDLYKTGWTLFHYDEAKNTYLS